ncbi:hypothetical protein, partial [Vibrio sp.]|uniref:hypothetical protein n=1 Tax=Vibrio sp. TaxID=678 RepID=UPI003D102256
AVEELAVEELAVEELAAEEIETEVPVTRSSSATTSSAGFRSDDGDHGGRSGGPTEEGNILGDLVYHPERNMTAWKNTHVVARLCLNVSEDELERDLSKYKISEKTKHEKIEVYPKMSATLCGGDKFIIELASGTETQVIKAGKCVEWDWLVTPVETGTHELTLCVYAMIDDASVGENKETFNITVNVPEFELRNLTFCPDKTMSFGEPCKVEALIEFNNPDVFKFDIESKLSGAGFNITDSDKCCPISGEIIELDWEVRPTDTGTQLLLLDITAKHHGVIVWSNSSSKEIAVTGHWRKFSKDYGISLTELIISAAGVLAGAGYLKRREKLDKKSPERNEQNGEEVSATKAQKNSGDNDT